MTPPTFQVIKKYLSVTRSKTFDHPGVHRPVTLADFFYFFFTIYRFESATSFYFSINKPLAFMLHHFTFDCKESDMLLFFGTHFLSFLVPKTSVFKSSSLLCARLLSVKRL